MLLIYTIVMLILTTFIFILKRKKSNTIYQMMNFCCCICNHKNYDCINKSKNMNVLLPSKKNDKKEVVIDIDDLLKGINGTQNDKEIENMLDKTLLETNETFLPQQKTDNILSQDKIEKEENKKEMTEIVHELVKKNVQRYSDSDDEDDESISSECIEDIYNTIKKEVDFGDMKNITEEDCYVSTPEIISAPSSDGEFEELDIPQDEETTKIIKTVQYGGKTSSWW